MKFGNLEFNSGRVLIKDVSCLLVPVNTLVVLTYLLERDFPKIFDNMRDNFENIGFEEFDFIVDNKKLTVYRKIDVFLGYLNSFGMGQISVATYSKRSSKIIFRCDNSYFSRNLRMMKKLENSLGEDIFFDFFPMFFMGGFLKRLFLRDLGINYYVKNGISYFEFEILNSVLEKVKSSKLSVNRNISILNDLMKKIIFNSHFYNKDGELVVWGIRLYAVPLDVFEMGSSSILKGEVYFPFKIVGEIQGSAAYSVIVNKFGSKKKREIFDNIYKQTELIGVGRSEILKFDEVRKSITIEFLDEILVKDGRPTIAGMYVLNIFRSVISNLFDCDIVFRIVKSEVVFESRTRNLSIDYLDNLKNYQKYMGIESLYK